MIIGIGTDMADIRRVARALERHGARFEARCFTEAERAAAARRAEAGHETRAGTFAKRWAAKEACAKALGAGLLRGAVRWRDIEVVNRASGQPALNLTGRAAARLAARTPPGMTAQVHVSLTDEPPHALAFVVIEVL